MALTIEDVCNVALSYIGQREIVTDITEDSVAAIVCRVHYDACRKRVLGERWWKFAEASLVLARRSITVPSGWAYAYSLPEDCLPGKARYIFAGAREGLTRITDRVPFALRWVSGPGLVLLTDHAAPELVYTRDMEELTWWPEAAVDAIAWQLAPRLALGMAVDLRKGIAFAQEYQTALERAMAEDMNSTRTDKPLVSAFEAVRG